MKKIPNDLKRLGERINELSQKEAEVRKDKPETGFAYATKAGFRVGTELLSGVLVGAALGYFLDRLLATQPLFLIIFLFLGGAAGILNVYRFAKNEENKKE